MYKIYFICLLHCQLLVFLSIYNSIYTFKFILYNIKNINIKIEIFTVKIFTVKILCIKVKNAQQYEYYDRSRFKCNKTN